MTHTRTTLMAVLLLTPAIGVPVDTPPATVTEPEIVAHHSGEAEARRALLERLEARGVMADGSWAPQLGPSPIDVAHYSLDLHLDIDREVLAGTVAVDLVATEHDLSAVELDADQGLRVLSVMLVEDGAYPDDGPRQLDYLHAADRLTIELPRSLSDGERVRVLIAYGGRGGRGGRGVNWGSHGDGVQVIHTFSEPFGARYWWPCNDRPDDKATVDMTVTAPAWLTVASNGLEITRVVNPDGTATTTWGSRYPVATYLVVMNVSDYVRSEQEYRAMDGSRMPVVLYAYPDIATQAVRDLAATPDYIQGLASVFGEYPFVEEKYGSCITPLGGGMEHQTLTTLGSGLVGGDRIMWFNVHELGHQWWGDWVSLADWRQLWLNEGFATFCEWILADHLGPEVITAVLTGSDSLGYFHGPAYDNPVPFSSTVYRKGAWILLMLFQVVGDNAAQAIEEYRDAFAGGNATTEGLRAVMEDAAQADLGWFFDQWVYGENRPRYQYSWTATPDPAVELTVSQRQTNAPLFRMPMMVEVTTVVGSEVHWVMVEAMARQTLTIQLEHTPTEVVLDPQGMVLSEIGPESAPDLDFGPEYPGPFDGGVVEVGDTTTITVSLTNLGGSELSISEINLAQGLAFAVLSPPGLPVSIAADETLELAIRFSPDEAGTVADRVQIVSNDPSRDGLSYLPLTGTGADGADPRLVAETALAFGQVPVGGASELVLLLGNDGGADLTLSASLADGDFSLAGPVPATLTPGEQWLVPVRLSPTAVGPCTATLTLSSNDPTMPELAVVLSGEGLAAGRIAVEPALVDLGVVEGRGRASLTVSNRGTAELVITAVAVDPPLAASTGGLPLSLSPGASLALELSLDSPGGGRVRGTVRILSSDPTLPWAVVPVHAHVAEGATWWMDYPAVARTPGLGGAQWFSDAVLLNPTAEAAAVDLELLPPEGSDGPAAPASYSVPPRQQRLLRDVVSELGQTGVGGLEVHTTSPGVIGVSRTYSDEGGGTFGQHIAAVAQENALDGGDHHLLLGLAGNGGFHTNLGMLNLGATPTTVAFDLYDAGGALVGTVPVTAAARGFAQANAVFSHLAGDMIRGGYAVLAGADADSRFLAFASVVDDGSHDPTFIPPMPVAGAGSPLDVIVPVVASNPGLNDTWWRSELSVINLGASEADVTVELYPSGGAEPDSIDIIVAAGEVLFLPDVVGVTFAGRGTGWLRLTSPASGVHVSSRTFNDHPSGTFGQHVPAIAVGQLFTSDDVAVLPGLRSAEGFRTNLGVTSLAGVATELVVHVFGDGGSDAGELRVSVPPHSFVQVGRLLSDRLGIEGWGWATLASADPAARFAAHASVVDGTTGDPAYIPAVAMP